jgi:hypothetical protein
LELAMAEPTAEQLDNSWVQILGEQSAPLSVSYDLPSGSLNTSNGVLKILRYGGTSGDWSDPGTVAYAIAQVTLAGVDKVVLLFNRAAESSSELLNGMKELLQELRAGAEAGTKFQMSTTVLILVAVAAYLLLSD